MTSATIHHCVQVRLVTVKTTEKSRGWDWHRELLALVGYRQMAQLDKKAFISFSQLTCDLKLSLLRYVFTQNFHRDVRNDPQLEIIPMLFSREEKDWDTCPAHRMLVTNQKETVRTVTRWTSLEEHILKTAVGLGQSCVHHDWLCTILLEQNNKISHFSGLRMEGVV